MKFLNSYLNTKKELEIIKLNITSLEMQEKKIEQEKEILLNYEQTLNKILKQIDTVLEQMEGIDQELFYEIIIKGLNPTKAIDKVAFKHDLDVSTLWKGYYPRVKNFIKSLDIDIYEEKNKLVTD